MAKSRKRHPQQELPLEKTHGGKRRGAGRKPPKGKRSSSPHQKRPALKRYYPVHVVMRVHSDVGSLRKRLMYAALREATITAARRNEEVEHVHGRFRIVHISIQRTHVHMLVEADNRTALSRGMQSFQISAAKHLNSAVSVKRKRRRGPVFTDRFHQEIIKTPRQARHALAYVLNNWRKHNEDRSSATRRWNVDAFSTGPLFAGWQEREGQPLLWRWRDTYEPLIVYLPSTWLLQKGWRERGGGAIPFGYVPSQPKGGVVAAGRAGAGIRAA